MAFALAGCQRGCLATWLDERGVGAPSQAPPRAALPLDAVDCPDGLARCVGGSVEVSRIGQVPAKCFGRPSDCACPWDVVASCPGGCVADDVTLDLAREQAATRLCATNDGAAIARPPTILDRIASDCEIGAYRCERANVGVCEADASGARPSLRPIAVCLAGCANDGDTIDDEVTPAQAVSLLCARPLR